VSKAYVLDACALIALLLNEDGADKVAHAYREADSGNAKLIMNAINLLEVYYDFYRAYGKTTADDMIVHVEASAVNIIAEIDKTLLSEAGRLKAIHKISLADSLALAQAKVSEGLLLTSDHHEFDVIEAKEPVRFLWIR
jgi:PIN domain nuclease of toxin-antitoxin system